MTSSSRLSNSSTELLRAPYAAPQPTAPSTFNSNVIQKLAPFVPAAHRDATASITPAAAAMDETSALGNSLVGDIVVEPKASTENVSSLPWIEAFVQNAVTSSNGEEHVEQSLEDSWPMGEAAKRLDELTESLTSIDASRALLGASEKPMAESINELPEAAHSMWNDDEWMDIMPTSTVLPERVVEAIVEEPTVPEWQSDSDFGQSTTSDHAFDVDSFAVSEPTSEELSQPEVANVDFSEAMSASYQHAEATARALEGLAERVRSGEVPVPAIQQDLGDAAVLAGVLASLLGWRR
ncbi:MAG: hypothetical protein ABJC26_14110 [Gemmatimonadaceae bacterium]